MKNRTQVVNLFFIAALLVGVLQIGMQPVLAESLQIDSPAADYQTTILDVVINELDSDTPSTDALEFVELFDGGEGNTPLDGMVVVFFNGSNDQSYFAVDLDGYSTNGDGYFVLGNAGVSPAPSFVFAGNTLQNGQDAVALYSANAADFPNGTAVTVTNLIDAVVYDTSDDDDPGLLILLNEGQPQINENGRSSGDTDSIQRCPNGSGGARNTDTFAQGSPTPGAANDCEEPPPPEVCGDPITDIFAIQGSGPASPFSGTVVSTEGIVVGDFQTGGFGGFHIQDPLGDDDTATSDGIFIYSTMVDVREGEHVRVRGSVTEFNGLTEINNVSDVWVCSTSNELPAPTAISLPILAVDDFEKYEGMLVTFPQNLIISEYFNYDRFGELVLTSGRHLTPTAIHEPGSPEQAAAAQAYILDRITLDDGRSTQNPDPAIHPNREIFNLSNLFRGGDILTGVTGIMDYAFSLYRIQPTQGAVHTPANPRDDMPPSVGGQIKVASFNVLNYFTTIDTGPSGWICGPAQNVECRGADTPEEFTRQRNKIIAAISAIDADVVGLMEIENNVDDDAVIDLVAGLNDSMGAGTYDYIETGVIGTDAIKVAMIYKPASLELAGDYAILDTSVDPRFRDNKNRPVLAQSFLHPDSETVFTVAVNHLKSKGSDCLDVSDPDLGDGAGNCNLTRKLAAEALVDWLESDPTGSGSVNNLIIGDLNSYDKEDPIDAVKAGADDAHGTADDYSDLIFDFQGEGAYGYVFDGQIGYLDHALANAGMKALVSGVNFWHINADEPDLIDYDMSFKLDAQDALYAPDAFRSSDHDPVIIGLIPGVYRIILPLIFR